VGGHNFQILLLGGEGLLSWNKTLLPWPSLVELPIEFIVWRLSDGPREICVGILGFVGHASSE
tara:strand:- start:914 stop:1102 length:189 start_codon:yes stop_codon:yes gene_type:complete